MVIKNNGHEIMDYKKWQTSCIEIWLYLAVAYVLCAVSDCKFFVVPANGPKGFTFNDNTLVLAKNGDDTKPANSNKRSPLKVYDLVVEIDSAKSTPSTIKKKSYENVNIHGSPRYANSIIRSRLPVKSLIQKRRPYIRNSFSSPRNVPLKSKSNSLAPVVHPYSNNQIDYHEKPQTKTHISSLIETVRPNLDYGITPLPEGAPLIDQQAQIRESIYPVEKPVLRLNTPSSLQDDIYRDDKPVERLSISGKSSTYNPVKQMEDFHATSNKLYPASYVDKNKRWGYEDFEYPVQRIHINSKYQHPSAYYQEYREQPIQVENGKLHQEIPDSEVSNEPRIFVNKDKESQSHERDFIMPHEHVIDKDIIHRDVYTEPHIQAKERDGKLELEEKDYHDSVVHLENRNIPESVFPPSRGSVHHMFQNYNEGPASDPTGFSNEEPYINSQKKWFETLANNNIQIEEKERGSNENRISENKKNIKNTIKHKGIRENYRISEKENVNDQEREEEARWRHRGGSDNAYSGDSDFEPKQDEFEADAKHKNQAQPVSTHTGETLNVERKYTDTPDEQARPKYGKAQNIERNLSKQPIYEQKFEEELGPESERSNQDENSGYENEYGHKYKDDSNFKNIRRNISVDREDGIGIKTQFHVNVKEGDKDEKYAAVSNEIDALLGNISKGKKNKKRGNTRNNISIDLPSFHDSDNVLQQLNHLTFDSETGEVVNEDPVTSPIKNNSKEKKLIKQKKTKKRKKKISKVNHKHVSKRIHKRNSKPKELKKREKNNKKSHKKSKKWHSYIKKIVPIHGKNAYKTLNLTGIVKIKLSPQNSKNGRGEKQFKDATLLFQYMDKDESNKTSKTALTKDDDSATTKGIHKTKSRKLSKPSSKHLKKDSDLHFFNSTDSNPRDQINSSLDLTDDLQQLIDSEEGKHVVKNATNNTSVNTENGNMSTNDLIVTLIRKLESVDTLGGSHTPPATNGAKHQDIAIRNYGGTFHRPGNTDIVEASISSRETDDLIQSLRDLLLKIDSKSSENQVVTTRDAFPDLNLKQKEVNIGSLLRPLNDTPVNIDTLLHTHVKQKEEDDIPSNILKQPNNLNLNVYSKPIYPVHGENLLSNHVVPLYSSSNTNDQNENITSEVNKRLSNILLRIYSPTTNRDMSSDISSHLTSSQQPNINLDVLTKARPYNDEIVNNIENHHVRINPILHLNSSMSENSNAAGLPLTSVKVSSMGNDHVNIDQVSSDRADKAAFDKVLLHRITELQEVPNDAEKASKNLNIVLHSRQSKAPHADVSDRIIDHQAYGDSRLNFDKNIQAEKENTLKNVKLLIHSTPVHGKKIEVLNTPLVGEECHFPSTTNINTIYSSCKGFSGTADEKETTLNNVNLLIHSTPTQEKKIELLNTPPLEEDESHFPSLDNLNAVYSQGKEHKGATKIKLRLEYSPKSDGNIEKYSQEKNKANVVLDIPPSSNRQNESFDVANEEQEKIIDLSSLLHHTGNAKESAGRMVSGEEKEENADINIPSTKLLEHVMKFPVTLSTSDDPVSKLRVLTKEKPKYILSTVSKVTQNEVPVREKPETNININLHANKVSKEYPEDALSNIGEQATNSDILWRGTQKYNQSADLLANNIHNHTINAVLHNHNDVITHIKENRKENADVHDEDADNQNIEIHPVNIENQNIEIHSKGGGKENQFLTNLGKQLNISLNLSPKKEEKSMEISKVTGNLAHDVGPKLQTQPIVDGKPDYLVINSVKKPTHENSPYQSTAVIEGQSPDNTFDAGSIEKSMTLHLKLPAKNSSISSEKDLSEFNSSLIENRNNENTVTFKMDDAKMGLLKTDGIDRGFYDQINIKNHPNIVIESGLKQSHNPENQRNVPANDMNGSGIINGPELEQGEKDLLNTNKIKIKDSSNLKGVTSNELNNIMNLITHPPNNYKSPTLTKFGVENVTDSIKFLSKSRNELPNSVKRDSNGTLVSDRFFINPMKTKTINSVVDHYLDPPSLLKEMKKLHNRSSSFSSKKYQILSNMKGHKGTARLNHKIEKMHDISKSYTADRRDVRAYPPSLYPEPDEVGDLSTDPVISD